MSYDTVFIALSWFAAPAWIMLVLSSWWNVADRWIHNGFYLFAFAIIYLGFGLLSLSVPAPNAPMDLTTLAGLKGLFFERPETLLLSWSHILAWDLFVGAWIDRDARRRDVTQWLRIAGIVLTYLVGPFGLLVYLVGRKFAGKGGIGLTEE